MQTKPPVWKRILRGTLTAIASLTLLCAFFLAVIMGHPQQEATVTKDVQPLLTPMPAGLRITGPEQLSALLEAFPAPVLAAMSNAALTFADGTCQDVPFESGHARMVTLVYRIEGWDDPLTVVSLYPARALDVMGKGDYAISGVAGLPLAGLRSIRMEKEGSVRMHAQGPQALYVVTLPEAANTVLRQLTSSLQLYGGISHE